MRPYIPQWEPLLPLPAEATVRDGVHIFKVTLGKNLWRRMALPATSTLDELAQLILDVYSFDGDHLYRFSYQNRYGQLCHINHTYLEEAPWTSVVRVGELPLAPGQTMIFLFDLRDRWEFEITLETVDTNSMAAQAPCVLERRGKAPKQYAWKDNCQRKRLLNLRGRLLLPQPAHAWPTSPDYGWPITGGI